MKVFHLLFDLNSTNVAEGSEEGLVKLNYDCFGARIVDYKSISQEKIEHGPFKRMFTL